MQVRTPSIGEVEEVLSPEKALQKWTEASDRQMAVFQLRQAAEQGSEEWFAYSRAFDFAVKRAEKAQAVFEAATSPEQAGRAEAWSKLQALLAECMEREEKEAFDEHYETLPCEAACEGLVISRPTISDNP